MMLAWCPTTTKTPSRSAWRRSSRSVARCLRAAVRCDAWKTEPRRANSRTLPTRINWAVSRDRHQGLDSTRATGTSRVRNCRPIRIACLRPAADRLRCVEQSSTSNSGGSPPPGASACRYHTTRPSVCVNSSQMVAACAGLAAGPAVAPVKAPKTALAKTATMSPIRATPVPVTVSAYQPAASSAIRGLSPRCPNLPR